ncbi:MAG: L,D-transpeptidase family protein [Acidobacteriia bacterium]|nr:L,D-transpeptidase family protein [Terriglobia bacterium]
MASLIRQLKAGALLWPVLAAVGVVAGTAAQDSGQGSAMLRQIAEAGQLADLRWPNFTHYRLHVRNFYEPAGYALAWIRGGQPTPQALSIIGILQKAEDKGLNPEDYDAPRWLERLAQLRQAPSEPVQARFDAAVTLCVMRYISDLHIGKVNPKYFNFGLDVGNKKYSLPDFLRQHLVDATDVETVLNLVEPRFAAYKRAQEALRQYSSLARQDDGEQLPVLAKTISPGSPYAGVPRLARLLRLLGDLPADVQITADSGVYQGRLVDGVRHFQARHGLRADGRLDAQTLKSLNTPLRFRVRQLQLTLERWRWLPHEFTESPIIVNIPEFRLRAYSTDGEGDVALDMNVIVGKAYDHKTPVFADTMEYVVFRPYWSVTPSIQRAEIVPAIQKDRDYVSKKGFEVITHDGEVVTSGTISDDVLERLRAGRLEVRQKPGPSNALGLVKLIFPNNYNVYLHSTPEQYLFARSRRDFSHGCVRVERPDELTAWVLRNNPGWDLKGVQEAMKTGKDNQRINLATPVPVFIVYGTAMVDETGEVRFLDDIYGFDADLEKVLARGYPYPG